MDRTKEYWELKDIKDKLDKNCNEMYVQSEEFGLKGSDDWLTAEIKIKVSSLNPSQRNRLFQLLHGERIPKTISENLTEILTEQIGKKMGEIRQIIQKELGFPYETGVNLKYETEEMIQEEEGGTL